MRILDPRQSLTARLLTTGLALWLCLAGLAIARDNDDPPDRVARLSFLKGDVSLKPAGTNDWALATLNRPLTTDDQLALERNARAELQAGSSVIHLDAGATFSFSELSDDVLQARITDGAMYLTVRRLQDDEVIEIDTPHAAITVRKPGDYRIEVLSDGAHTLVKTYSGECEVAGNRESMRLRAREQVTLDSAGQAIAARESFSPRDAFDAWAQERNERSSRSASLRYVAPSVIGYEDLDAYGDWASEVEYGNVWYPRITVGWAPYREGHWAWVSPWGWTWVDDAPWGFAPFHYGRWAHVHGRWGWVPGPIHLRAVYAPALVAWLGGPAIGLSVSFGSNVGWFPLGPREVYVPGYHCSSTHIHNVNYSNTVIVNNTIINRAYANRATPIDYQHRSLRDAVTVVSRDTFVSARPVGSHLERDHDVRNWQTHNAAPAIAPDRASALGPRWNANETRTPERWTEGRANRDVVVHRTPPPVRASFEQEQRAIRDNNNRPISRGDLWGSARNDGSVSRNSGSGPEQRSGDRLRDDRPRRVFDRSQEEVRPNAIPNAPPAAQTPRTETPRENTPREREGLRPNNRVPNAQPEAMPPERLRRERETPRVESPRAREAIEQPRIEQPRIEPNRSDQNRVEQNRVERPRAESPREVERPRNVERPRPVEITPPPVQRHDPPPQAERKPKPADDAREERHQERGNRGEKER